MLIPETAVESLRRKEVQTMKTCLTAALSLFALMIVAPSVRADVQDKVKDM